LGLGRLTASGARPTQALGAAVAVLRGIVNECVTCTERFGETVEKAYIDAVQQGYLPASVLDTSLIRLSTARIKLGRGRQRRGRDEQGIRIKRATFGVPSPPYRQSALTF